MIGIIGGSGFYKFLDNMEAKTISTPFGDVDVEIGSIEDNKACFIPRHGKKHSILPQDINYRANIYAAHMLGVTTIYATNAMGSMNEKVPPGSLVIPDQILDFTHGRKSTFFDDPDFKIETIKGRTLQGVIHTDVSHPFDEIAAENIWSICKGMELDAIKSGTVVTVNGPRYETPAEIKAYRILGADYAGMTSSPEAFLAKEIDIPYATLVVVTNYAAGMQSSVSHTEVEELFNQRISLIHKVFKKLVING